MNVQPSSARALYLELAALGVDDVRMGHVLHSGRLEDPETGDTFSETG